MSRESEMQQLLNRDAYTIDERSEEEKAGSRLASFEYLDEVLDRDLRGVKKNEVIEVVDNMCQRLILIKNSDIEDDRKIELEKLIESLQGVSKVVNMAWEKINSN